MSGVYQINHRRKKGFFNFFNFSVTIQLISLNVVCFILSYITFAIYGEKTIINNFALVPSLILSGQHFWVLITSMFLHGGFFHLFANVFSLFFIGTFLEKLIGKKRFLWTYIIAGVVGGLFFVFASSIFGDLNIPAVGASGAIFGLLGVLAVLVPHSKIYLIAGPFVLIILDAVLGNTFPWFSSLVNILIILMIFSLFSFNSSFRKISLPVKLPMWLLPIIAIVPLAIISLYVDLPIGNSAHLGGLVVGIIYGVYLRRKFPNKTRRIQQVFK
ncbi:MAG: rhomboid family intramembrane serine protease [archaeon]